MQAFNPKNRVHEQPPFCAVLIKNAQKTKNIQNINLMVSKIIASYSKKSLFCPYIDRPMCFSKLSMSWP